MATKKELYDRAGELGINSRDGMTKAQLADAIMEAEAKGNPLEEPTPEDKVEAGMKSNDELLDTATAEEDKRKAKAAERELKARSEVKKEEARKNSLKRKLPQKYEVVTGCLISRNGCLTDLEVGSIVSAETHNLNELRKAGAELVECKGTKLVRDQFGRSSLVAVR